MSRGLAPKFVNFDYKMAGLLDCSLMNELIKEELLFQQAFKTIVVGVDFSPYSKIVVKQAQSLCRLWKTKLVLVHAIDNPVNYSPPPYGNIYWPNLNDSKTYVARIRKFYGVPEASTKIRAQYSSPVNLLISTAKKFERSLIMVGYKGHNKVVEFVFGSTAQYLAMAAKIPVWIHRGDKVIRPKKILIPHDLSQASDHSIDVVKKLSLSYPATYEVFHVNQKPYPIFDYNKFAKMSKKVEKVTRVKIQNLLSKYPRVNLKTGSGEVTDELVKRSKHFDLLVMAHHNPKSLLSKSETAALMKIVRTPIIVAQ